jgi:hypothetical protein
MKVIWICQADYVHYVTLITSSDQRFGKLVCQVRWKVSRIDYSPVADMWVCNMGVILTLWA